MYSKQTAFLAALILTLINIEFCAYAQEFQTPLDLVNHQGNPFDDPNYYNRLEIPGGDAICAPSFVVERDSQGRPVACGPYDFYQDPKSYYIGCYQSLQLSDQATTSCTQAANQLVNEVESLKARLLQCKKSRGRKC